MAEVARHHADDRVIVVIQPDSASNRAWRSAEDALPGTIADDGNLREPWLLVVGNEPTKPPPPFPPPQAVSSEATKIREAGVFKNVSFDAWMRRL